MAEQKCQRYKFTINGVVVLKGWTLDTKRRAEYHMARNPNGRFIKIGRKVTISEAVEWEKQQKGDSANEKETNGRPQIAL